jgi:EAL domain-containing protein (putative c-di-GMP-specific phosphodiesterase class I)
MYHAKKNGRNNYQFFTNEMNQLALECMSIERKLRHAVERQEFCLHYQPQVDLRSGRIIGVEALLRWNNPETGMISPGYFIPIAEETGLIIPIGEWVLREACRQNSEWRMLGLPGLTVAVNLSAVQFRQNNFGEMIKTILCENGLEPSGLELEITEGVVMQNAEASIALLLELKAMGLKLVVDDFGTGYSSLSYLKRFPIDKLKIDQSFVRDITVDSDDAVIVSTIINMARTLKLKVIAEGVETAEQLSFLKHQECDEIQGYYFSQPVPPEKISSLLVSGYKEGGQWLYVSK